MKKILFALPFLFAILLVACDASVDDKQPGASVTVDELTNSFQLVARSEGNNNITVKLSPVRYVKVYSADNDALLAEGTNPTFQVTPPTTELDVYITAINQDGSITKSSTKSITVSEYTDLPAIYEQIFGLENGEYGTTKWTWDDTLTRYWGMEAGEVIQLLLGGELPMVPILMNNVKAKAYLTMVLGHGSL